MRIPNVPKSEMFEDTENKKISDSWMNYFSLISDELQFNAGPNGLQAAILTTDEINNNADKLEKRIFYDNEKQEYHANNSGLSKQMLMYIELSAAEIALLPAIEKKGFIYDTTNDDLFIGIAGVLRQITIT